MNGGSFGVMDQGYFVSKGEIFKWVEDVLGKEIKSIEGLGTGAVYCELMNRCFDGKQLIAGIISAPKLEHEYVHNLKLFQKGLDKLKVQKKLDILKMAKCKYLDNLEVVQWLKRFLQTYGNKQQQVEFTAVNRVNSPRLFTSPNLKKKFQSTLSPRGIASPRINRLSSALSPNEKKPEPRLSSPSSKLSDIKNLLKSNESEAQKLKIIKQLIENKSPEPFPNLPQIPSTSPFEEQADIL